jgi:uncharacterized OB-fold protein
MEKEDSKNANERSTRNKNFNPGKYGMAVCPSCRSNGYIQNPIRQCCPMCQGFGFIRKKAEEDTNISSSNA